MAFENRFGIDSVQGWVVVFAAFLASLFSSVGWCCLLVTAYHHAIDMGYSMEMDHSVLMFEFQKVYIY